MPPSRSNVASPSPVASPAATHDPFMRVVPWLSSRYDFGSGSFTGRGDEAQSDPALLAAQATAILHAIELYPKLPYLVRAKLAAWPVMPATALAKPAKGSALAAAVRDGIRQLPHDLSSALESFTTQDGGFSLNPSRTEAGQMSAAYHLLVEARPAWCAALGRGVPKIEAGLAEQLGRQFLPIFVT